MDLAFTKEELAFREEVRAFFRDNVPPETRRKLVEGRHLSKDEMIAWWRILNKKGWGVSHWPKEYGGTGWTSVQHYIFNEELQMHPAPAPLAFGVSMVGPVIYTFGTASRRERFLPSMLSGSSRSRLWRPAAWPMRAVCWPLSPPAPAASTWARGSSPLRRRRRTRTSSKRWLRLMNCRRG